MADILFIAFLTQCIITMGVLLGYSLWIVDSPDIERRGPIWQSRYKQMTTIGGVMAVLMLFTLAFAILSKIHSI